MAATNYSSKNFNLGPATKVETQNALKIKNQASPQTPSPQKANKYMGMSDAAIKKAYIGMTQAQKKANGIAMAKASQANKKKKSTASSSSKTTPKPKPTPTGDGSVKAIRVKTSFEKQSEARKRQAAAIDGVGPSREQRKKDMSPEAMAKSDTKVSYKSSKTTPKEGDKKRVSGILKVYKNGRWVKVGTGKGTR